uniref:Biogenesis of lysosome-related organelles complex 1 subunit BLS1 n=1 Tax=Steinernema glaseri TaxID=37863 RepID=A0A1I7YLJ6_9BILA
MSSSLITTALTNPSNSELLSTMAALNDYGIEEVFQQVERCQVQDQFVVVPIELLQELKRRTSQLAHDFYEEDAEYDMTEKVLDSLRQMRKDCEEITSDLQSMTQGIHRSLGKQ